MGCCHSSAGINANVNVNVDRELRNILCPSRKTGILQEELSDLESLRDSIEEQIEEIRGEPGKKIRKDVVDWVDKVRGVVTEVNELLNKPSEGVVGDQRDARVGVPEVVVGPPAVPQELPAGDVGEGAELSQGRGQRGVEDGAQGEVQELQCHVRGDPQDAIGGGRAKAPGGRYKWWGKSLRRYFCCVCQNYSRGEDVDNKLERVRRLKEEHDSWKGQLVMDIRFVESPLEALREEVQNLLALKSDTEREIEGMKMERLVEMSKSVCIRMKGVDEIEAESKKVTEGRIQETDRISRIRGRVLELTKKLGNLRSRDLVVFAEPERVEDILWHSPPRVVVDVVNNMVDRILGFLERDEEGQLLGIYGAGGVGKSTLVGELNRRLKQTQSPDLVICVEVKRGATIFGIQENIGRRLGYSPSGEAGPSRAGFHLPADERDRAKLLRRRMSKKKCLLILDDVCESIDLRRIGVPTESGNRCKVVLTTRDEHVCDHMRVHHELQFQLVSLNARDSWTLFRETFRGNDLLKDKVTEWMAEEVVGMCGGIPRVIETVARAMPKRQTALEWGVAANVVNALSAEIGDSGDDLSSRFSEELARKAAVVAAEEAARARWVPRVMDRLVETILRFVESVDMLNAFQDAISNGVKADAIYAIDAIDAIGVFDATIPFMELESHLDLDLVCSHVPLLSPSRASLVEADVTALSAAPSRQLHSHRHAVLTV